MLNDGVNALAFDAENRLVTNTNPDSGVSAYTCDDRDIRVQKGPGARAVKSPLDSTGVMARLGRLERPTSGSGDQRSIQLSYRRACGAADAASKHARSANLKTSAHA